MDSPVLLLSLFVFSVACAGFTGFLFGIAVGIERQRALASRSRSITKRHDA